MKKVHHLVLEAFVGPRPTPKHQAAHWDGNPLNNAAANLRWATAKENIADKYRHDRVTRTQGDIDGMAKLTAGQVQDIRKRYAAGGVRQRELGDEYGVCQSHISAIINRVNWSHLE
jgi:hypothetical protein